MYCHSIDRVCRVVDRKVVDARRGKMDGVVSLALFHEHSKKHSIG